MPLVDNLKRINSFDKTENVIISNRALEVGNDFKFGTKADTLPTTAILFGR